MTVAGALSLARVLRYRSQTKENVTALFFGFLLAEIDITTGMSVIILLLLSIPALIVSICTEKKYKAMLATETK